MTKEEVQEVIELKQQEMPFDVKARAEALPISGKQIVTLPGVRRCGNRWTGRRCGGVGMRRSDDCYA